MMSARFSLDAVCREQTWCLNNLLALSFSSVNALALIVVCCRLQRRYCLPHWWWYTPASHRSTQYAPKNFQGIVNWMVLILCYLDLVFFLADIFFTFDGDAFPVMYLLKHGATNKSSYSLSYALARQVLAIVNMVWHLHLAHVAFLWVVKRYSAACIHRKKLRAFHQTLVAAVVLLALAISLCSLLSPAYAIQTVAFASATMAVIILPVCTAVLVYMYGKTAHELQAGTDDDSDTAGATSRTRRVKRVARRLFFTSLCIAATWILTHVLDLVLWLAYLRGFRHPSHLVGTVRIILLHMTGLYDAGILGGLCDYCIHRRPLSGTDPEVEVSAPQRSVAELRSSYGAHLGNPLPSGQVKVFVTTWNMGGRPDCGLNHHVRDWVPPGYDMYVVCLQECSCIKGIRTILHDALGGPERYTMFKNEIGDSVVLHGVIALTIFVRTADVQSGAFHRLDSPSSAVKMGANLGPLGTAANKGSCAIFARYYDVSMAVIAVHFAADSKGSSQEVKRHTDSRTTLRELCGGLDANEFNVHLQYHHVILAGDLNYRLQAPPHEVVRMVSESVKARQQETARHDCQVTSYRDCFWAKGGEEAGEKNLQESSQMEGARGKKRGGWAAHAGAEAWDFIREYDELVRAMLSDRVFSGFREGAIRFPPSYRWHRDAGLSVVRDFSDPSDLNKAYCTVVGGPAKADSNASTDSPERHHGRRSQSNSGSGGSVSSLSVMPPALTSSDSFTSSILPSPQRKDKNMSKLRTPSYTDRILTFSMPSKSARLCWRGYELNAALTGSDHKPVSACFDLFVEPRVHGFIISPTPCESSANASLPSAPSLSQLGHSSSIRSSISMASRSGHRSKTGSTGGSQGRSGRRSLSQGSLSSGNNSSAGGAESQVNTPAHKRASSVDLLAAEPVLVTLRLTDLDFDLDGLKSSNDLGEVVIMYPLVSEDPLGEFRRSLSVFEAFKDSPAKAPRGMQTIRRCVYSKHGIQTTFAASRHFSEHAVIKFLNKQGQDLGQGILPVNRRYLHLSSEDQPIENHIQRHVLVGLSEGGTSKGFVTLTMVVHINEISPTSAACMYDKSASQSFANMIERLEPNFPDYEMEEEEFEEEGGGSAGEEEEEEEDDDDDDVERGLSLRRKRDSETVENDDMEDLRDASQVLLMHELSEGGESKAADGVMLLV